MRLVCGFVVAYAVVLTLGMIFLPDHAAQPKRPVETTAPSLSPTPRPMLHAPSAAALGQLEPCESVLDRFGGQHGPCMRYHVGGRVATLIARPSVSAANPNPAAASLPTAGRWLRDPKDTVATSLPTAGRWLQDPKDTVAASLPTAGRWLQDPKDTMAASLPTAGRWLQDPKDTMAASLPAAGRWLQDPKDTVAASLPTAGRWLQDPKDTARQVPPPTALQVGLGSGAGRPRPAGASRNVTATLNRESAMQLVAPRFTQREPALSVPAHHPHPDGRSDPPFRRTGSHVTPILQNSRPNQASRQPGRGSAGNSSHMGGHRQASPKRLTGSLAARGRGRGMTSHLTAPHLPLADEACAAKCSGKR